MRKLREYFRPTTLDEALRLFSRKDLRVVALAGGTHLATDSTADIGILVDLSALPLAYIRTDGAVLHIGALTTLQEISIAPAVRAFAGGVLADSARLTCTALLRSRGTLAGTILSQAANGDLSSALLALNAEVVLRGIEGSIALQLSDLLENPGPPTKGAILTEVRVPSPARGARAGRERIARTPADRAILSVTAIVRVVDGVIADASVAIAGVGLRPRRLPKIEAALAGAGATAEAIAAAIAEETSLLDIQDHPQVSAEYRKAMLPVLIARAALGSSR